MRASAGADTSDPFARYRLVGTVMALLVLIVGAIELWNNWRSPGPRDFISFWGAAQLAIQGRPELAYDLPTLHQVQSAVADFGAGTAKMPFPYLPAFLLLVLPFGFLQFPAAMAAWVVVTGGFYLFAMQRLVPRAGLLPLAFPPVAVNLAIGQNGLLTAAMFAAAMAALPRNPFVAGLIAGCFIIKPQLALLFPIAFLAARLWPAVAGAALSAAAVLLIGLVAVGPEASKAWLNQLPLYGAIAREGSVGWLQFSSVFAAARQAGLGSPVALGVHFIVAAAAAIAVWFAWRSPASLMSKAAVLAAATALASPYLFLYDQVLLVIPLLWLARKGRHSIAAAMLWLLPIAVIAAHYTSASVPNIAPLPPIALLVLLFGEIRSTQKEAAASFDAAAPIH